MKRRGTTRRAILLPWSINSNERTFKDYIPDRIPEIPFEEFHEPYTADRCTVAAPSSHAMLDF